VPPLSGNLTKLALVQVQGTAWLARAAAAPRAEGS
jgi:hypothetical protein